MKTDTKIDIILIFLLVIIFVIGVFMYSGMTEPHNCRDFRNQKEAQDFYDKDRLQGARFDADKDGVPCEELL